MARPCRRDRRAGRGRLYVRRSPPGGGRLAHDEDGEAANRLARLGLLAPDGVEWALAVANRNFIIHRYDELNRAQTWLTLRRDLPAWGASLEPLFVEAAEMIGSSE